MQTRLVRKARQTTRKYSDQGYIPRERGGYTVQGIRTETQCQLPKLGCPRTKGALSDAPPPRGRCPGGARSSLTRSPGPGRWPRPCSAVGHGSTGGSKLGGWAGGWAVTLDVLACCWCAPAAPSSQPRLMQAAWEPSTRTQTTACQCRDPPPTSAGGPGPAPPAPARRPAAPGRSARDWRPRPRRRPAPAGPA